MPEPTGVVAVVAPESPSLDGLVARVVPALALPPGAVHLAATRHCRNQGFRIGDRAWGLQFHLEADAALIERWLSSPGGRREIETHWGPHRIPRIRAATRDHVRQSQPLSDRVFGEFARLLGPGRRQRLLNSR